VKTSAATASTALEATRLPAVVVKIRHSPDSTEETALICDTKSANCGSISGQPRPLDASSRLGINQPRDPAVIAVTDQRAPFKLAANEPLKLRIFSTARCSKSSPTTAVT
jgi:hypothetical protein